MGEVTSAIVAATLVLGAVFVPVAFLPGTTGLLLRQFGLAVTCAVLISLLNALTLSPALCALVMRPEREHKGRFFRAFDRGFGARGASATTAACARCCRAARSCSACSPRSVVADAAPVPRACRPASCPTRTRATSSRASSSPTAPSLERTRRGGAARSRRSCSDTPGVVGVNLFGGFDVLTGTSPAERRLGVRDARAVGRARRAGPVARRRSSRACGRARARSRARASFALNPAPIRGLSRTGGFEFQLQDRARRADRGARRGGAADHRARRTSSPELAATSSRRFRPNVPQIYVDLDRTKAKTLGVRVDDVFETLQTFMGGTLRQRLRPLRAPVPRVRAGRGRPARDARGRRSGCGCAPSAARWCRSRRWSSLSRIVGPRDIPHYNVYRSARIQGEAAPGYSSGPGARRAWRRSRAEVLPDDDVVRVDRHRLPGAPGRAARRSIILALSLLVVFLFLAAQYESWSLPLVILLVVPLAFLGALGAQALRGLANDLYCQIGLVTLIGLASQELDPDRRVREAPPRGGREPRRRGARGGRDPLPPGGDDGVRVHPRRGAARDRERRRRRGAPLARHGRVRRHARRDGCSRWCSCPRST